MKKYILIFMIMLSGCTSVIVMPTQESGYYAVGNSVLIEDAIICKSNRPKHASAIRLELPEYELIRKPVGATSEKGCQMREMNYVAVVEKGKYINIEEFRILDASFPMAYPNLHALGKYDGQNGTVNNFYYRLGAANIRVNLYGGKSEVLEIHNKAIKFDREFLWSPDARKLAPFMAALA